ncbi:LPS export ABC transporter permease LptF [Oceanicella sp. SM1341]|uniref:LPS export ABC transporter permease LptF n=1 Tax=Oceanicella sp. SM1341 TaxID=1548889 RepID=UPI0013007412|nr:LPS export ABC transporter permease LptF [Oceanicella sp. SM1341]
MNQLDRYIFGQIVGPFGFFALIFTGVIWLSQSLRIIDLVVNNGQSAAVFAEFTALLLPTVMSVVMPVSAFAATLFALNRLYSESELVVMMASGRSFAGLARPVAMFGLMIMAAMMVVTLYLMPTAARQLRDRMADLRGDIANVLIREGQFIHPSDGITIYVGDASRSGEMADIFIHDMRNPAQPVTYSANRAALVRANGEARVVMFDGTAQQYDTRTTSLSTLRFDTFTYDLTALMQDDGDRRRKPSEYYVGTLVNPPDEIRAQPGYQAGDFLAEGHEQIVAPLYALVLPLVAATFILLGGFRRRGFAVQIWLAIGAGLGVRLLGVAAKAVATGNAALWPVMYAPPLITLAIIVWLLARRHVGARRREAIT